MVDSNVGSCRKWMVVSLDAERKLKIRGREVPPGCTELPGRYVPRNVQTR